MRSLAIALLFAGPALGQELAIDPFGSLFPGDGSTNVVRSIGQKGIFITFVSSGGGLFPPGDPALPLQLGGASVNVSIGGAPAMACALNDLSPAAGQCGFAASDGPFPNGVQDSLQIALGDLVPLNTTVSLTLGGITSSLPGDPPFTLNTWSFTTRTTPIIRDPLLVELVLDVSGSMNRPAVPGAPAGAPLRREAMRDGIVPLFMLLGQYGQAGDRIGTVYFDTAAVPFAPGGGDNTLGVLAGAADGMRDDILATYGAPTGGGTSIGAGLLAAQIDGFDTITPAPALPNNKVVVLMSDGEQNTPPMVAVPGGSLQVDGLAYDPDTVIYPITAGRMLAPGYTLQADIAAAAGGALPLHVEDMADTIPAANFETYFVQNLADELIGDKVEMVIDDSGKLAAGDALELAVPVTEDDVALSFFFSATDAEEPGSPLRGQVTLIAPDGRQIDLRRFLRRVGNHVSAKVPLPALTPEGFVRNPGDWQLVFDAIDRDVTYHAMVMLDSTMIWSEYRLDAAIRPTGTPIHIQVDLKEGDDPVTEAEALARVRRPDVGIGDFVASADIGPNDLTGGEPFRAWQGKLTAVLADPELGKILRGVSEDVIKLVDDGDMSSGDAVAGDGIYSGYYFDTMAEGNYAMDIEVTALDRNGDRLRRVRSMTTRTVPVPDPSASKLSVFSVDEAADGSADVVLQIRLLDRFGAMLGLGYGEGALRVEPDRGLVEDIVDRLDGSYEVHLHLPALPGGGPALSGPPVKVGVGVFDTPAFAVSFKELGDGTARDEDGQGAPDKDQADTFARLCRALIDTLWLMSEQSVKAHLPEAQGQGRTRAEIETILRDAVRLGRDPAQQRQLQQLFDRALKILGQ
ncbi:hypothetical protein [Marinibacterium sp. SX1]|uniref:hypothetical protein n=1 Tax=Marinibacterium sp. SX1 TaxID=3388424 RepID=UPI003D171564